MHDCTPFAGQPAAPPVSHDESPGVPAAACEEGIRLALAYDTARFQFTLNQDRSRHQLHVDGYGTMVA